MGHLNGILARVGGNLNNNFQKSQMPGGLPGGGMLKLRFDRYIMLFSSSCNLLSVRLKDRFLRADVSKYRPEVSKSEKSKILKKIHKVALGKLLT